MEKEDPKESIRQLSTIFSNANFPCDADNNDNPTVDEDHQLELNIGITMPYICATEYYLILLAFNAER